MRLFIHHTTHYRFETPVSYGLQQLRKAPKNGHQQQVLRWETDISGGKTELSFTDHHRNTVDLISFDKDAEELVVTVQGEVEMDDTHGVVGRHLGPAPLWLYLRQTERTKPGAGVRGLLRGVPNDEALARLHALSGLIHKAVTFDVSATDPGWSAEDALSAGRGVCQDHTHVFLSCARELGFPARYVSGYLMLNDRVEQEAMHAWAEAHVDGLGWVGFDAANGYSPDARYVRVATGLDYSEAAPITGLRVGGVGEALDVQIQVAQQ